jgi:hypothetical protein
MYSRSATLRADKFSTSVWMPMSVKARLTAVDFPIPDGPSSTRPRPGVRNATFNIA